MSVPASVRSQLVQEGRFQTAAEVGTLEDFMIISVCSGLCGLLDGPLKHGDIRSSSSLGHHHSLVFTHVWFGVIFGCFCIS